MQKAAITAASTLASVALLVIIILLAMSFAKVDTTEVGLMYSHASQKIDRTTIYNSGRYYVGVSGEFITYPKIIQELELPIFDARTQDGLKLSLEISITYSVVQNITSLLSIFDRFGRHYDGFLSRLVQNLVRDAAARETAFNYAMNRSAVNANMERELRMDMESLGFNLDSLQLLDIMFPPNFTSTMQNTLILQQQVSQVENEKEAELVAMEGEVQKADATAVGIVADARSEATAITESAQAQADAFITTLEKEAEAHKLMLQNTFGGNTEDFINWYWVSKMSAAKAKKNVAMSIPEMLVI